MIGFNGGLIGKDRSTSASQSVPGVWTLREQLKAKRSLLWPSEDPPKASPATPVTSRPLVRYDPPLLPQQRSPCATPLPHHAAERLHTHRSKHLHRGRNHRRWLHRPLRHTVIRPRHGAARLDRRRLRRHYQATSTACA
jgi:hypothetical protein